MKQVLLLSTFALGAVVMSPDISNFKNLGCTQPGKPDATVAVHSESPYILKRMGDEFAVFRQNAVGNVSEYFLVQGSDWNIATTPIVSAQYQEGSDIKMTGADGLTYQFSIRVNQPSSVHRTQTFPVYGIAHYRFLSEEGAPLNIAENIAFRTNGGGEPVGCDTGCLSGGCGAVQCSRTIGPAECSVSCESDRFACCADLITQGCHCRPKGCCTSSKN